MNHTFESVPKIPDRAIYRRVLAQRARHHQDAAPAYCFFTVRRPPLSQEKGRYVFSKLLRQLS